MSVTVTSPTPPDASLVTGSIVIAPTGSETLRVPWAVSFRAPATNLIVKASLDHDSFKPSDLAPAILTIRAGALVSQEGALQVEPVSRLDLLLYTAGGRFLGRLARAARPAARRVQLRHHRPRVDERPARAGPLRAAPRRLADAARERPAEPREGPVHHPIPGQS